MYVLLVSHGPGFIEMPSLDTAKSNKSELSSLAGCLGGDVGVCNPRPERWKRVLSQSIWGGGGAGGGLAHTRSWLSSPVTHRGDQTCLLHGWRPPDSLRIRMFPTPPAKITCLTFCLTDSEAIKYTASTQLAINWRPELD